jgi:hypothetical protein
MFWKPDLSSAYQGNNGHDQVHYVNTYGETAGIKIYSGMPRNAAA